MNTTNANQTLGFDKFSECNYNLHWSFSNFNRMLMAAGQIAQLPYHSKVLELGAGTSDLENLVKKNFKRDDIEFVKIDGDVQYESDESISVFDITSDECAAFCRNSGPFDAVVFMEVIEHLNNKNAEFVLNVIYAVLKNEGMMILTTPTPPYNKFYENRVWPHDHEFEYDLRELEVLLNKNFKINKKIGWSLEEREFNELLSTNSDLAMVYTKLRSAFPESYIRAIIASLAPVEANRQVLVICKKRRARSYGRFTQTR
ncbi:MAG: methyltransferase domain-containing protein [Prevotella sp.]|nr:methyltransferase domain-containing protein [Prevotella sp.]